MVYKRGAFAAGQMQKVVTTGKRAENLLKAGAYSSEAERLELEGDVLAGKRYEKMLEDWRRNNP